MQISLNIKNILAGIVIISFIAFPNCRPSPDKTGERSQEVEPLKINIPHETLAAQLKEVVPDLMKKSMIPGLSVAIVRGGQLFWSETFGKKNLETGETADRDTLFEACSLSKPVFAYAVLKLVANGVLELDMPLCEYVSDEYIEEKYLRRKIEDERIRKITTRMVLSHTPGFPNWRRGKLTINFEPGEKFSYSGEGYVFLQHIVAYLTGQDLNGFMTQYVFTPLGMNNSSYVWRDEIDPQLANPHSALGEVRKKRKPRNNAAASLITTAEDFARFIAAVMNKEGLSKEMSQAMLTSQIKIPHQEYPDSFSWGLGLGLEHSPQGDVFWHWGDNGDFKCFTAAYPKEKLGVVYFANSANGLSIAQEIVKQTIGGAHPLFSLNLMSDYPAYDSPEMEVNQTFMRQGFDAAFKKYEELKALHPGSNIIQESFLNNFGYTLLRKNRTEEAIKIFTLNVELFPESFNVYDSLGEAYLKAGNNESAINNYLRSLKLNPENESGIRALKKLGVSRE